MNRSGADAVYAAGVLAVIFALGCGGDASDALVVEFEGGGVRLAQLRAVLDGRLEHEGESRRADILNEELDRLLTAEVTLSRARELGIEISDGELDAFLTRIHGPEFEDPDPGYREEVRRQLLGERAALLDLADRIHISDEAILTHFEEQRDRFQLPARIQIRQIVVEEEERARRLRDQLRAGADFAALSQTHSLAPEAGEGGLLPPFARGELPEVFDRAFELGVDEISEVLESPYGFHIFQLVARYPAQVPELADVRDQILGELQNRRLTELRREWLRDLRKRADIRINERLLETLR